MIDADWGRIADAVATAALFLGAVMTLTTAIGLLRLRDLFSRQHAAAKPQALGVLLIMLGVGLSLRQSSASVMLLLAAGFQLLTIPVAAHMITRAAYRGYVRRPGPGEPATDDAPQIPPPPARP